MLTGHKSGDAYWERLLRWGHSSGGIFGAGGSAWLTLLQARCGTFLRLLVSICAFDYVIVGECNMVRRGCQAWAQGDNETPHFVRGDNRDY